MEKYIFTCRIKEESDPFIQSVLAASEAEAKKLGLLSAEDSGFTPIKSSICICTLDFILRNGIRGVTKEYVDCDLR